MLDVDDDVDSHLQTAPALGHMASLVRLSPSHFAQKSRQSTGVSLHRFINLRLVQGAIDTLKANGGSLETAARNLRICSQSHFTREFRGLAGMTPTKYRKSLGPTVR